MSSDTSTPPVEAPVMPAPPASQRTRAHPALLPVLGTLAACGGGEDGPPPPPPPPPPPLTAAQFEASRLLAQASLGASDAEIDAVVHAGVAGWIDAQLGTPPSEPMWNWLVAKGYNATRFRGGSVGLDEMVWRKLFTAPDALRQRVVLALTELFVVSIIGVNGNWRQFALAAYWELLEQHCFGTYRNLLERITLSVAMGRYLNMLGNQKENLATGRQPDENYAREVLQLFSIGLYELNPDGSPRLGADGQPIETYDQATISGLARVFTGWSHDGANSDSPDFLHRPMAHNPSLHSLLEKKFLGKTIPANTAGPQSLRLALDTIAAHSNVGPFIGRQLIQRLVTSNPSPAYVARVAAVFNDSGGVRGNLGAVVRAILVDPEARTVPSANTAGRLREPVLRFVQWGRTFKATSPDDEWYGSTVDVSRLGQSPFRSPSVFNFFRPGYVPPNTALGARGMVAPELQITNETTVAGFANFMQGVLQNGVGDIRGDYAVWMQWAHDASYLVARLNMALAAGQVGTATAGAIAGAVGTIGATTDGGRRARIWAAALMIMCTPEYLVLK
jgi:uncharacterized protein (DUF1800 family)